jgi:threonyl-tRNA synthetase
LAEDKANLHAMRHSLAHIMAAAIQEIWPETKFGVGPVIENGFYYDIDPGHTISEEDLGQIESGMNRIIQEDTKFEQYDLSIDQAIEWAKTTGQVYKEELLNDLKTKGTINVKEFDQEGATSVSFYKCSDFTDLCKGPHVESTGKVGAFKLHKVAGAYWRGDETRPQLQRIYAWAFTNQAELDAQMHMMTEAEQRDHRRLGRELDLFVSSDLVGSGLPMFTPKGTVLRELLGRYTQQLRQSRGFERVWTPHMTKTDLYKTSGHWDKFGDELFLVKSQETSDELVLKPMNCPHHTQIYASSQRSYRELPIRYMENTTDYRDEKSGELHGLSRVRSLTQDDSHVFCREDQIGDEVTQLVQATQDMYSELEMTLKFRLSFRDDGDGYLGEKDLWQSAQDTLRDLAGRNKLDYYEQEGEAAFYGPKIDFIVTDSIGREWQVATVQLDFVQPSRFGLTYIDADGSSKTPVMIHCALLGTIERFLSVYIEHTGGNFPFWLAPEQIRILTINDTVGDYAAKITKILDDSVLMKPLKYNEIRYSVDDRNESIGKKIREASSQKVPVMLIVGPRDKESNEVSVRTHTGEQKIAFETLAKFIQEL